MTIGDLIKERRKALKLSQDELAKMLYIDRSTISKWERNVAEPRMEQIKALNTVLGITIEDIKASSSNNSSLSPIVSAMSGTKTEYMIIGIVIICCRVFQPWSLPFGVFAIYYSIKKKMPLIMKMVSIFSFIFCLYQFLFFFGIYLFPPIVTY